MTLFCCDAVNLQSCIKQGVNAVMVCPTASAPRTDATHMSLRTLTRKQILLLHCAFRWDTCKRYLVGYESTTDTVTLVLSYFASFSLVHTASIAFKSNEAPKMFVRDLV